ncbi:MAG: tetratricopeptide repeat protein [Gallionella sp.]|nr:tetratricopeptide repeat protein [Gallionella sp.]
MTELFASTASANLENNEFEAAWQRLLLLLETPEHFGVMFVFSGNDLLRQALLSRLEQAATGRALAVQFLPEQPWRLPDLHLTALDPTEAEPVWLRLILADCINTLLPAAPTALRVGILSLDGNLPLALHTALSAQSAWTPSDTSDPIQASIRWAHLLRRELLARLNERRTQLEQRGPLLILLPLDATKATAELAPDLWTVRLTSHYLQPQATNVDMPTLPPLPHAERTFGGEITPAHREILAHWQQRQQAGNTKGLQVWDGLNALDTAMKLGLGKAAVQKISQQVVALAYTRGTVREQMLAQNALGDVARNNGELEPAMEAYKIAFNLAQTEHTAHPNSTLWQRDLSVAHNNIGDIHLAQGDLAGALLSYRASLTLRERLALHDAANTQWQRDLSFSHIKIGEIQQAQGDLAGALLSYRTSLTIRERLALHDAANTQWQRDLSVSHIKIGDIQQAQGDLAGALLSYRTRHAITERLAQHDAANVQWQTDVVISCVRLSSLRGQGVSDQEAAGYLQRALSIAECLQREGKLNAQQQVWVEDLRARLAAIGAK